MEQLKGQLSLYDLFNKDAAIGPVSENHVGYMIPFTVLKNYVGKMIVYCSGQGKNLYYRVIKLTSYYEKAVPYYSYNNNGMTEYLNEYVVELSSEEKRKKMKKAFICDKIGYSDDKRTKKENSWISEAYSSSGRYHVYPNYAPDVRFFEYKPC